MQKAMKSINRLYLPDCKPAGFECIGNTAVLKDPCFIHDRMEHYDCRSLNDAELLAFISGIRPDQALEILRQYRLYEIEEYLEGMEPEMTARQKKAVRSAFEFSRRVFGHSDQTQHVVYSPRDLASLVEGEMRYLKKEIFICIHLNTKNVILRMETISIGSLNASIVHPREVFSNAVKHSASSVILCHNHPSGDPQPSPEDIDTTKRLADAGNILGIRVLDHVIIGNGSYVSLKESGFI